MTLGQKAKTFENRNTSVGRTNDHCQNQSIQSDRSNNGVFFLDKTDKVRKISKNDKRSKKNLEKKIIN